MAQAVCRLGGHVAIVEGATHVLAREPEPLGVRRSARCCGATASSSTSGMHATAARRDGDDVRLSARGRRRAARWTGFSSPPAGDRASRESDWKRPELYSYDQHGVQVNAHLQAGDRLWGDRATSQDVRMLTHIGKYQGDVVADNILGKPARGELRSHAGCGVYRSAGCVGRCLRGPLQRHGRPQRCGEDGHLYARVCGIEWIPHAAVRWRTADRRLCTRDPRPGEWLQQATLAIRARVPLETLRDVIQPFPTFSEMYVEALKALRRSINAA